MAYQMDLPEHVRTFTDLFFDRGYRVYPVGGCVRDSLLGKLVVDWDFTTDCTPEMMLTFIPHAKYENSFGTVLVPIILSADETQLFEITPFRTESMYTNNRHPDAIEWAKTLDEDVQRRDFTINALAYDIQSATIIDLVEGKHDLEARCIRAVGNPKIRFQEDALRMLRAIRFSAQLGFTIEEKTLLALSEQSHLIQNISWERIRDELTKIIMAPQKPEPSPQHSTSDQPSPFLLLHQTGLLKYILPELDACFGVDQKSPERHHQFDVGTHLVEALRNCPSTNPVVRWATLLHDIGKAQTRAVDPDTGITTFYNHEVVGAEQADALARRLKFSKKDRELLVNLIRQHMFSVEETQTDKSIRRFIRRVGKEHIQDMLDIRTADRLGSGTPETSWRTELFKKRIDDVQEMPFEIRDLAIKGEHIMEKLALKPSPIVGTILKALFEEVVDGTLTNELEALIARMEELAPEILSTLAEE